MVPILQSYLGDKVANFLPRDVKARYLHGVVCLIDALRFVRLHAPQRPNTPHPMVSCIDRRAAVLTGATIRQSLSHLHNKDAVRYFFRKPRAIDLARGDQAPRRWTRLSLIPAHLPHRLGSPALACLAALQPTRGLCNRPSRARQPPEVALRLPHAGLAGGRGL